MTSQREPSAVRVDADDGPVPPEVPAQLSMSLELLDAADAIYAALDPRVQAQIAAMSQKQAHEQYVASLAVLPPQIRDRIRLCVTWLRDDLSSRPVERLGAAAPQQLRQVVLRLVSFLAFVGMA